MLGCTPAYGRLGVGSALLRWGLELADQEGLNTWLESAPQGYPLYRRFGFEDVDVFDLPVACRWGATCGKDEDWGSGCAVTFAGRPSDGTYRCVMMRRRPVRAV